MDRLRTVVRSTALRLAVAAVVAAAVVVVAVNATRGPSTYRLDAVYASAPGLFPGAAVDVLGVPVGTVTSVKNVENRVEVGMQVRSGTRIPTRAYASLVAPQLLGQPDVDLNPGYTGGAYLRPGATIGESRTSVPVSTDQFLKQLQHSLQALNPHAVGDLVTNLAQDLNGQGAGLNQLIKSAAGTIQLLADKGDNLGQLNGSLAQLTGTLDSETAQIEQLAQEYDTVSTVVAQHSGQLNGAITQLSQSATALVGLLTPNLQPLEADVGTVATVGRTLDRNIANIDQGLAQSSNLFQGAKRVFNPTYNWLDLNLAMPPGVTGDYVAGLIRDRLSGVCRRILANHAAGLTAAETASLTSCGNPASGFFNPLAGDIPSVLGTLNAAQSSSAASTILQNGMGQIGAIGATAAPSSPAGGSSPSSSATTPTPTTTPPPSSGSVCGLLGGVIGCPQSSTAQKSDAIVAPAATSGPSLTAQDADLLPPLPSARHRHHRQVHRSLLAQWAHDVGSWL